MEDGVAIAIALVAAYAGARFGGVVFDNMRNVVFERVGQDSTRRLAENVFGHLHNLSMRFHMNRRTGAVTKVIERGTKSIDIMLYFLLFNIAPTLLELILVSTYFQIEFGWGIVAATWVMVVAYISFTAVVTNWRNKLREEMNELDTQTVAKSVDSLLNYETVKYFNAEKREAARYNQVVSQWADAAVKSENSLAALNIGQSLITNLMMAGAMGYVVWGWSKGQFTTGDVVTVNTLAGATLPAARHARHGLSHHKAGPDRHGCHVRSDRHRTRNHRQARRASVSRQRRRGWHSMMSALAMIRTGKS